MPKKILILNGPGLGSAYFANKGSPANGSFQSLQDECTRCCKLHGFDISFHHTDIDDNIIDIITHDAPNYDGLIFNPINPDIDNAGKRLMLYRPAISMLSAHNITIIEIHMTNIARQADNLISPFHQTHSSIGFISGLGVKSYTLAIEAIAHKQMQKA